MHKPLHLALLLAAICGSSAAQAATFDIPAQPLASALTAFARQSGCQLLFNPEELKTLTVSSLRGELPAEAALERLLAGSGLSAQSSGKDSYVIRRNTSAQILPEVLVRATQEASYRAESVALAGKLPLKPREIPNSVSVLTRRQLDDQELTAMPEAMQQVTGLNVIANDTLSHQYLARGYQVGVMYDGIPSYNGLTPSNQFDLALYEQLEVLRGPAGLLRGVGEPGGVLNLVKKKPGKDFAASATLSAGSWDSYREMGDITGALNADQTLRGRFVAVSEQRGYFHDHSRGKKWAVLGAVQYLFSPQTVFDVSFSAQRHDVDNPYYGLPASSITDASGHYQMLKVSPSTYHGADWNRMLYDTREASASLEHRFANEWVVKASYNARQVKAYAKEIYTGSTVDSVTRRVTYWSDRWADDDLRTGLDIYAGGPFTLFGRKHNFLLGYNSEHYNHVGRYGDGPTYSDVVWGDESALPEPVIAYASGSEKDYRQSGWYSQLRLNPVERLTAVLGGRTTSFDSKNRNVAPSPTDDWKPGAKADNEFTPYAGLLFDLSQEITLYASYADIFIPQTQKKEDGSTLDPRVGRQNEIGAKGEFFDAKLGVSLAAFKMRDKNRAFRDPAYPTKFFYLNAGEVESRGTEFEVTGKPLPGMDISLGYTHLKTRYVRDRTYQGKSYSIQTPAQQFKFWGNYRFGNDSALAGWSTGLGIQHMGKAQSSRGRRDQVVNDAYTVVNARVAYQIDKNYSLSLMINNLLDKKYYASVGQPHIYNFYGEPRNFMLTLHASY